MGKKLGRPKTKNGKRVTFFLSLNCIYKLIKMTQLSRNKSKLIESLVNERFEKFDKHKNGKA